MKWVEGWFSMTIREGQEILLYVNEKKSWIVTVESGKKFHTHKGIVDLGDLIGKEYGTELKTTLGLSMKAIPVDYLDNLERVSRKTQIIYPKDIALITLLANVRPGSRIVECGTGSGSLTSYLATHVQPDGMVYTYELREEFQRIARRNLERMGLIRNVEMKLKDINEGIDERDVDAVVLDMATPWQVVGLARDALRAGGRLVSFSPTINQVEKTVEEMRSKGFLAVKV
ncbi:MAG: tRNA (adenine-N1)-methyltransferase, partial [Candidatus Methanosuratincola sp.]